MRVEWRLEDLCCSHSRERMSLLFVTGNIRLYTNCCNRWKTISSFHAKNQLLFGNPITPNNGRPRLFPLKPYKTQYQSLHMTTAVSNKKKSLKDLSTQDLKGKRVLVRCDLNVPLDGKTITDDTRIRASLPTIQYLIQHGAKVILSSHLGRPKGGFEDRYSLAPVAERLGQLLGKSVKMAPDCIGDQVANMIHAMNDGDVILLENVRFYKEETDNDPEFSRKLSMNMDLYVNDAFGSAHRAHASTQGVTAFLRPSVAGFLLEKELEYLQTAIQNPQRPFAAIVGDRKSVV